MNNVLAYQVSRLQSSFAIALTLYIVSTLN